MLFVEGAIAQEDCKVPETREMRTGSVCTRPVPVPISRTATARAIDFAIVLSDCLASSTERGEGGILE